MKVSIIIPNFNGRFLLEKNLPSVILAAKNKSNEISEIIVIDDGSRDDSVLFLKKNYPNIKLIKHTINRGFSAAVNTGVRSSSYDLLCIMNSDVIPSKDFLVATLPHFKDVKTFAVSLHEKGYTWARGFFKEGFVEHAGGIESDKLHNTFWVSGGSGVFRRSTWVTLGGLDEKLFSPFYWEDLDISYRALKRGYDLWWEPKANVLHEHESTVKNLPKRYVSRIRERNQLIFIWKNITSKRLIKRHVASLIKKITRHPGYLVIFFMALVKIKQILKARRQEEKESKVSDEIIFARFQN